MSKKVAIILSGCGGFDGSEVQESVCSILAIEQVGFSWEGFSLDENQAIVKIGLDSKPIDQSRNMLSESSRITHGNIKPIEQLDPSKFDVLWFPGGFGVVTSFSDIAKKGDRGSLHPQIEKLIQTFHAEKKAIVAVCIAPTILAIALKGHGLTLTLGNTTVYDDRLKKANHHPLKANSEEFVFDKKNNIYTTPAYMNQDATCSKVFDGCKGIANQLRG